MEEKVKLDENTFAAMVTEKYKLQVPQNDLQQFSKECLRVYLNAYILAQDFNNYEEFDYKKSDKTLFESFIEHLTAAQKTIK